MLVCHGPVATQSLLVTLSRARRQHAGHQAATSPALRSTAAIRENAFRVRRPCTDLLYGLGAQYMVTDRVGIVGEWEWYDMDDDVDLLSVGVMIKF